jgi:hypothetical protein
VHDRVGGGRVFNVVVCIVRVGNVALGTLSGASDNHSM